MKTLTAENVLAALRPVRDPELDHSLVELGMIKDVRIEGGRVSFLVELTTPACRSRPRSRPPASGRSPACPESRRWTCVSAPRFAARLEHRAPKT